MLRGEVAGLRARDEKDIADLVILGMLAADWHPAQP
jgi:hypothetical protein